MEILAVKSVPMVIYRLISPLKTSVFLSPLRDWVSPITTVYNNLLCCSFFLKSDLF